LVKILVNKLGEKILEVKLLLRDWFSLTELTS